MRGMAVGVLLVAATLLLSLGLGSGAAAPELTDLKLAAAAKPAGIPLKLTPDFSPAVRAYRANVGMSVANISVLPTATCSGCSIFVCINSSKIAVGRHR